MGYNFYITFRWAEVEAESGLQIVHKCGGIIIAEEGTPAVDIMKLYTDAMDANNIKYTSTRECTLYIAPYGGINILNENGKKIRSAGDAITSSIIPKLPNIKTYHTFTFLHMTSK